MEREAASGSDLVVPEYALGEIRRIMEVRRRAPGEFTTNEFKKWLERKHGKSSNWEEATKILTELEGLGLVEKRGGLVNSTNAILWKFINPNQVPLPVDKSRAVRKRARR